MRERTMKGAWLAASALCTALLLACAGENAVQTFHAQTRQSEAARPQERGALAGCVIALDAGHGGYDGGAVGRVSGRRFAKSYRICSAARRSSSRAARRWCFPSI